MPTPPRPAPPTLATRYAQQIAKSKLVAGQLAATSKNRTTAAAISDVLTHVAAVEAENARLRAALTAIAERLHASHAPFERRDCPHPLCRRLAEALTPPAPLALDAPAGLSLIHHN